MRRDPEQLLAYEIGRRPELADLDRRLSQISYEELDQFPFQLKWMRDAFKTRKRKLEQTVCRTIDSNCITDSFNPDLPGKIFQWRGEDEQFLKVDRGHWIAVRHGRYLFKPNRGGIFIDTLYSQTVDPIVETQSVFIEDSYLSGYKTVCANVRNTLTPSQIIEAGSSVGRLAGYGVRFS